MSVTFSQMPDALLFAEGSTFASVKVYHAIFCETLGRPGWDISFRQLAETTGLNERTVRAAIDWLCESGWLIKTTTADERGHRPNLYAVCTEPGVPYGSRAQRPVGGGAETLRGGGLETPPPVEGFPGDKETPLPPADALPLDGVPGAAAKPTKKVARKAEEPTGFAEFYDTYPRHVKRPDAMKAYAEAIIGGAKADQIMAGLREALPVLTDDNARGFCPYPASWLRDRRWLDRAKPTKRSGPYVPEAASW